MEATTMGSSGKDHPNPNPNPRNATPTRSEGERSIVNPEGFKFKARSKSVPDLKSIFSDPLKGSTISRVANHKRKFSEGEEEVTSEKISKKLNPMLIDPATKENGKKIKVSNPQKNIEVGQSIEEEKDVVRAVDIDLNYPPIHEGAGKGKEVVSASAEHPTFQDNNLVFTLDEANSESSSMGENDEAANGRVFKFDLNKLPPSPSDEDHGDST